MTCEEVSALLDILPYRMYEWRMKHGLSYREAGYRSGVEHQVWRRTEKRLTIPRLDTLQMVLRAMGNTELIPEKEVVAA